MVTKAKLTKLTHKIAIQLHPAPSGRELFHLQYLSQAASPETFGYTLVYVHVRSRTYVHTHTNIHLWLNMLF